MHSVLLCNFNWAPLSASSPPLEKPFQLDFSTTQLPRQVFTEQNAHKYSGKYTEQLYKKLSSPELHTQTIHQQRSF